MSAFYRRIHKTGKAFILQNVTSVFTLVILLLTVLTAVILLRRARKY